MAYLAVNFVHTVENGFYKNAMEMTFSSFCLLKYVQNILHKWLRSSNLERERDRDLRRFRFVSIRLELLISNFKLLASS